MTVFIWPSRFSRCFPRLTPCRRSCGNKIRVSSRELTYLSQRLTTRSVTRLVTNSMNRSTSELEAANSKNEDDAAGAKGKVPCEDVLVQYVVLRRDLIETWPMGSVVTQGCHASVAAIWGNKDDPHTIQYCSPGNMDSMHKVTLEVKGEVQMLNLSEKLSSGGIVHKVWIEQPENIPTCLATKPYPKAAVASFFKKLKLCK